MQHRTTYCSRVESLSSSEPEPVTRARAGRALSLPLPLLLLALATPAVAVADDGYCDYVEGTASAQAATLFAPELFAQLGYIELNTLGGGAVGPDIDNNGTRFVGGVRWRLTGIYEGIATKSRASADCARYRASEQLRDGTVRDALVARMQIYQAALPEAEKILAATNADFEARRATAQEAMATRLRVEEIRRAAAETQAQLSALPPGSNDTFAGALRAYQAADAKVEENEAKLRRWRAIDLSVRFGVDEYLSIDTGDRSPFFGVVSLGVNLGVLFQGSGNARAASGRKRLVTSAPDALSQESTAALAKIAERRATETATLEADLKRQIDALDRIGGDDARRYRLIVWFDWIKVRAEHAYHQALSAALKQVVSGQ